MPEATGRIPARCPWCGEDPLYVRYHDHEWGVPNHDERHLFEMINLEGAQAGLSWITILRKRDNYRKAFAGFDPDRIARFNRRSVERLMGDAGIVRNRLKIEAVLANARALARLREAGATFDEVLWRHVDGRPIVNHWRRLSDVPAETEQSGRMSRDLKSLGFRFVGPTVCYAFMQAVGMINDHLVSCYRYRDLQ